MITSFLLTAGTVLLAAGGIGFLIFIHEFGHFIAARRVGIRVEVFSLGFGPPILEFKRGATSYRISLVPLGGYVKMAGENPGEARTGAPDEFASKGVGQRLQVILAGVVMNALFAIPAFIVAFSLGVRFPVPRVGTIEPESPADRAGLERGDRILRVNDREIITFLDLHEAVAVADPADGVRLTVERAGETRDVIVHPRPAGPSGIQTIGVEQLLEVSQVADGSPAEAAGFRRGDVVMAIDGAPIEDESDFETAVFRSPGTTLHVGVEREEAGRAGRQVLDLAVGSRPRHSLGITLDPSPVVAGVEAGGPADLAGLRPFDVIRSVDGETATRENLRALVQAAGIASRPAVFVVDRPGESAPVTLTVTPAARAEGGFEVRLQFGGTNRVAAVADGSPAAAAGIHPGDQLFRVGLLEENAVFEPEVSKFLDHPDLRPDAAQPVEIAWRRPDGEALEASVVPIPVLGEFVGESGLAFGPATYVKESAGVGDAVALGIDRTGATVRLILHTIQGLLMGRISTKALGGPVMITYVAYRWTQLGFGTLLYFLGLLSMNLAILNVLPIPILDGGHVVFLAIEKVQGRPLSEKALGYAQWAGLVLLLFMMLFVTMNDILRFF